jgi:hypothetical protein
MFGKRLPLSEASKGSDFMKNQFKRVVQLASVIAVSTAISSCGNSDGSSGNSGVLGRQAQPAAGTQIDRLARPAINEGLEITDASLNAFNSIPPSADLSAAAAPARTEAASTLTAFAALGASLGTTPAPSVTTIVGAFLPDVMRIDTTLAIPPGKTAYNAGASATKGILIGGRKLEDDVIDITLSFLVAGDATGKTVQDGVSYSGVPGNPNQPGHQLLTGQSQRLGGATFPFLATPN